MEKIIRPLVLFSFFVAVFISQAASAVTFPPKPQTGSFYTDQAKLISAEDGKEIDRIAAELWRMQQIPIVVATIPSLSKEDAAGYTPASYAAALFEQWGIGALRNTYGLLLFVSQEDQGIRIEVGRAWGHRFDMKSKMVMDDLIVPQFRRGNFSEGILEGVRGLEAMVREQDLPEPKNPWWHLPLAFAIIILIISMTIALFRRGRRSWAWQILLFFGNSLWWVLRYTDEGMRDIAETKRTGSLGNW